MTFDSTITAGNVLTAIVFLLGLWASVTRAYRLLDRRSIVFEHTIDGHTRLLESHAIRMEKQDDLLLKISGDMQRIVGRLEMIDPRSVADAAATALQVVRSAESAAMLTIAAAERAATATMAAAVAAAAAVHAPIVEVFKP